MSDTPSQIQRAVEIKTRHEESLMQHPGVVGVGVGMRQKGGQPTDEVSIVIMVEKKHPLDQLDPKDVLPREIEGIPVDVLETGEIRAD